MLLLPLFSVKMKGWYLRRNVWIEWKRLPEDLIVVTRGRNIIYSIDVRRRKNMNWMNRWMNKYADIWKEEFQEFFYIFPLYLSLNKFPARLSHSMVSFLFAYSLPSIEIKPLITNCGVRFHFEIDLEHFNCYEISRVLHGFIGLAWDLFGFLMYIEHHSSLCSNRSQGWSWEFWWKCKTNTKCGRG